MRRDGERLVLEGTVTLANVAQVLEAGERALEDGASVIDLGEVGELDSSLIAVLFAWLRRARAAGRPVGIINAPDRLVTIARLYGVIDLLPRGDAVH